MENEAAPTGGRLASPEVIGGKSNRHSGEKGAPQAPFFHAFFLGGGGAFWAKRCCGALWKEGRGGRLFFKPFFGVMAGERGGGELGGGEEARWAPFFHAFFWGVRGGRGLPRGRAVVTGFAAGAGRSGDGVRAGGGWSRGVRAPFFVVWGMEPSLLGAAVFFWRGEESV